LGQGPWPCDPKIHLVMQILSPLEVRYNDILQRIECLERASALSTRFDEIEARLDALESMQLQDPTASPPADQSPIEPPVSTAADESDVHARLKSELIARGIRDFRFVRAPSEYYEQPLEFRMEVCKASSIHHLCKALIMVNTRAAENCQGWSDPTFSQYYLVIIQYSKGRIHTDKLNKFIHGLAAGRCGKSQVNMRLCREEVSNELSGFEHNAVSPIGLKERLPMVISDKILKLEPDFFFLGAGEVDLKVGLRARDFVEVYKPFVCDLTYD
jgi:prolyl-tRNA editing enzyme YbaK/EbsC (Cys-tRNA(Pro) deacylase)